MAATLADVLAYLDSLTMKFVDASGNLIVHTQAEIDNSTGLHAVVAQKVSDVVTKNNLVVVHQVTKGAPASSTKDLVTDAIRKEKKALGLPG